MLNKVSVIYRGNLLRDENLRGIETMWHIDCLAKLI